MVELEPPLPAESAVPVYVTAPVVVAPPVVMEYVQPAPYVAPAPAVIHAAPAPGVEKVTRAPTDHGDSTCFSCFPAIGHGADRDVVCAAGDLSNFVIATDGAGSCVCCLWSMQTNDTLLLLFFHSLTDLM